VLYKSKELESIMPMDDFKKTMLSLLDIVNQKNKNISLLGDFNIDLLNENNHFTKKSINNDIANSNWQYFNITK